MSFRSIFYLSTFIVDKHLLGKSQSSLNLCTYVPFPSKAYKMIKIDYLLHNMALVQ